MTKLKVRKVGNSLGVILTKDIAEKLRVAEDDTLFITETPDGVQITPYDPEFEKAMEAFEKTRGKYRNAFRELSNR